MEGRHKRRNYFIDKSFQTKFMVKFCVIVIISSLLIIGLLFFLARGSTTVAIENTEVVTKGTADFILPLVIQTVLLTLIFSVVAVLLLTMIVLHKMAGPLFRLKSEVDAMKGLDLRRSFSIRGNDQLQSFARALSEMSAALRKEHLSLKGEYKRLKSYLEEKGYSLSEKDKDKLIKSLRALEEGLDRFRV
jgi:methyl-accepting chemotaxis protein